MAATPENSADTNPRQLFPKTRTKTSGAARSARDEVALWADCVQQAGGIGATLARLFKAELDLAVASFGRLVLLGVLVVPVLFVAWLSTTAIVAWWSYLLGAQFLQTNLAISIAMLAFLLQHIAVAVIIIRRCKSYSKDLRFPVMRHHLWLFRQGLNHGLQGQEK